MTGRSKAQRLTSILDRHRAYEQRTMADLRVAGFKFTSVQQAKNWLKAAEAVNRMTPDEVIDMVARQRTTRGTK